MNYTPPFLEDADTNSGGSKTETEDSSLGHEPTAPSRLSEIEGEASDEAYQTIQRAADGLYTQLSGDLSGLQMNLSRATGSSRTLVTFPEAADDETLAALGGLDAQQLRALSHAFKSGEDERPKTLLTRLRGALCLTYLFGYEGDLLSLTLRWERTGENARVERVRYVAAQVITQARS